MTKEEKELLLKDLCGRLPYHPKINIYNDSWEGCRIGEFDNELWYHHIEAFNCDRIEITPYLRPMESMTTDEERELELIKSITIWTDGTTTPNGLDIDWLNAHHFDYRGLIEKGLALPASEEMYKTNLNKL